MKRRFTEAGRITNHEMGTLRELPNPRKTRWQFAWCAVSNVFHPVSQEDWQRYVQEQEDSE